MKYRGLLLLPTLGAVVAGLLVASPAEAASHKSYLKSKSIAISSTGKGKVAIACKSSSTCKGTLRFVGSTKTTKYSVPAKKTVYRAVALRSGDSANPHRGGTSRNGQYFYKTGQKLRIVETSPKKATTTYAVTTETPVWRQQITGVIAAVNGSDVSGVRVELLRLVRGGNTSVVRFVNDLSAGDRYTLSVPLGANNSPSGAFRLRISAKDQDGISRTWYWRGRNSVPTGGGRYLNEASVIQATKTSDFNADFRYSSIRGTAPAGTTVTVVAPPRSYKGGSTVTRELDFVGCGNAFGETRAASNGTYRIDFLPYRAGERRYMVSARRGSVDAWYGRSAERFGSCFDVGRYAYSTANLIDLDGTTPVTRNVDVSASGIDIAVNGSFSGFSPTTQGDRWIRLRERVPGAPILDAPVVAERLGNASGNVRFSDVPPGNYWVELGRRTGCSDWYPSRFPNNAAYFKGQDRGAERWKAFRKLSDLNSGLRAKARSVRPNPATDAQNKVKAGSRGWMYRSHCRAVGAGKYVAVSVRDTGSSYTKSVSVRAAKGASVSGRVVRSKGRTNKEIMVRLSSTDGVRVLRTAMTDGSGRFTVSGLPSGNWSVAVNSDSWRGIGRAFKGRHSIRVNAGRSYSVGTLRFNG
ncbi:carboxypeptidase-like regulatory domain-containing protein [Aeromicrobium sp. P5_D10]